MTRRHSEKQARPTGPSLHLADRYAFRVFYSAEDGEYVGLCAEFPGLSWLDKDASAAFTGIRRVVRDAVNDMEACGEALPEPVADRPYSGVFQVRVTPDVHRRLVIEATEQNTSLNRLAAAKLAMPSSIVTPAKVFKRPSKAAAIATSAKVTKHKFRARKTKIAPGAKRVTAKHTAPPSAVETAPRPRSTRA